jgi:hypothetical protein
MSLKIRISDLEKRVPEIKDRAKIHFTLMYGSQPSKEEGEIAINKLKELSHGSSGWEICFIPYKFIDDFQCYFPKVTKNIEWDRDLGVDRVKNTVYKLVEKYDKRWVLTGSNVQPVFVFPLKE